MEVSLTISDLQFNQAYYQPGDPLSLSFRVEGDHRSTLSLRLQTRILHLGEEVETLEKPLDLPPGETEVQVTYQPPLAAPRGYGLDVCLLGAGGEALGCAWTAFDVLNHWTESPRYGFLVDFSPEKGDVDRVMDGLTRFHINGLQFYDWMYRHDQFLTDQEPYRDPLGRLLSRETVEDLITAAHQRGIAAMPYTAIYASSEAFYQEHQDWALYQASGEPYRLGEHFLVYMDPRPDSPWVEHLLGEFQKVLEELPFDGIHLDQYGDPKAAMDASGKSFVLDQPLRETINRTAELVKSRDPAGAVIFNAVNNWPIGSVASSDQDLVYIEVWPPHIWYQDLHRLIVEAQELGDGKPVVLAAYIDPDFEHNAHLLNAVIFASGGGHIELGEDQGMLADPYFPEYKRMSPELAEDMTRYYDFAVRYQDVIGPRTRDAGEWRPDQLILEGVSTDHRLQKNKVWPIVREGENFLALNLINLLEVNTPEWTKEVEQAPRTLGPTVVRIYEPNLEVDRVWFASPDGADLSPRSLEYTVFEDQEGRGIRIEIPSLAYWDLFVLEGKD